MKNALIFRPGEKSWDRKLDKACAFYDSDDDDNALAAEEISDAVADGRMWPALESRGAYFVCAVQWMYTLYRLPIKYGELDGADYAHIYHTSSFDVLQAIFRANPKLHRNHVRVYPVQQTRVRRIPGPVAYNPERAIGFGLDQAGIHLRPPVQLVGPDIDAHQVNEHQLGPLPGGAPDLNTAVNQCWQTFLRDLMTVVPSGSSGMDGGRYCLLDEEQIAAVTEALYQQCELPFRRVILKRVDGNAWHNIFDRFFPTSRQAEKFPAHRQHWLSCPYWTQWQTILDGIPVHDNQEQIRGKLRTQFDTLVWVAHCESDRIWRVATSVRGSVVRLPTEEPLPAPHIAVNAARRVQLEQFTLV